VQFGSRRGQQTVAPVPGSGLSLYVMRRLGTRGAFPQLLLYTFTARAPLAEPFVLATSQLIITNSVEQSPSSEANSHSATQ
jgi:hypothetical protein